MLTFCDAQLCKQNAAQDIGRLSMYGPYFVRSLGVVFDLDTGIGH